MGPVEKPVVIGGVLYRPAKKQEPAERPQQPRPGGPLNPQQAALLQQVQMLTPQQIDALPPQQRAQLQQLRAQFNL